MKAKVLYIEFSYNQLRELVFHSFLKKQLYIFITFSTVLLIIVVHLTTTKKQHYTNEHKKRND